MQIYDSTCEIFIHTKPKECEIQKNLPINYYL